MPPKFRRHARFAQLIWFVPLSGCEAPGQPAQSIQKPTLSGSRNVGRVSRADQQNPDRFDKAEMTFMRSVTDMRH